MINTDKRVSTSSWTNEQLFKLANRSNHKIVTLPSGDYMWKHNIDGIWVNHCIDTFDTYKKLSGFLIFSLELYSNELVQRYSDESKRFASARRKMQRLKNSITKSTAEKIRQVKALELGFTNQELADELGVNIKTVQRALKGDYYTTGTFPRATQEKDSTLYYNMNDNQSVRTQSREYIDYVAAYNSKLGKK